MSESRSGSEPKIEKLSAAELLEIERVCDACEADFHARGQANIDLYLDQVSLASKPRARRELVQLLQALSQAVVTRNANSTTVDSRSSVQPQSGLPTLDVRGDRFELNQLLGSGGAGTVWKAFDRHLGRWVALKVPRIESCPDSERFLTEARTVARLQHPHIVRVLDAGQDRRGCFIVSELIEGMTLADKLKQMRFEPHAAALLLSQVADALAYAHRSGIVHRDLKPHNILIDQQGNALVFDFGLACEWMTSHQMESATDKMLGTPAYMAPEQATGSPLQNEPRTDIYAMGVILFQLLTGELPFRGDVTSILHQLIHQEAPQPADISPIVPAELNTICNLCLEKEPARRLHSALFLRDELLRFVKFQPIQSRPIHPWGRLRKWARRNPILASVTSLATVSAAVTVLVSVLSVLFLSQAWEREHQLRLAADAAHSEVVEANRKEQLSRQQAVEAQKLAEQNSLKAQAETRLSQQSLHFLESMIQSSDPVAWLLQSVSGPVREAPRLADMLDSAKQRAMTDLASEPRIQARMLDTIANGYRSIGKFAEASSLLDHSASLRSNLAISTESESQQEAIRHSLVRAMVYQDLSEIQPAQPLLNQALAACRQLQPAAPLLEADIEFQIGWLLCNIRKPIEAQPHFERALALRQEHCPADSSSVKVAQIGVEISQARNMGQLSIENLATIVSGDDRYSRVVNDYLRVLACRKLGRLKEAISIYEVVLQELEQNLSAEHPLFILAEGEYAELCWRQGFFRKALPAIDKAIAAAELIAPQHAQLISARETLGYELLRAQRFAEAGKHFEKAIEASQARGQFSAIAHEGLLWVRLIHGESDLAYPLAQKLVDKCDPNRPERAAWYQYALARVLQRQGKEALSHQADAEALRLALSLVQPPNEPIWLERLATILAKHAEYDASENLLRKAIDIERAGKPSSHPHLADRLQSLANTIARQNRQSECRTLYQEILAIREASLPEDDPRLRQSRELAHVGY